jgi:hypothetical protein
MSEPKKIMESAQVGGMADLRDLNVAKTLQHGYLRGRWFPYWFDMGVYILSVLNAVVFGWSLHMLVTQ